MQDYREIIPWVLMVLGTFLGLKKDWISSKFFRKEKEFEIKATHEDVESKALDNVEKTMGIYRGMVEDLKKNIEDLKSEIIELRLFIDEQKLFIQKQNEDLLSYERKYGKE